MKYQIADTQHGPFNDVYDTLEQAKTALAEFVKEEKRINDVLQYFLGKNYTPQNYTKFYCIVNAETGEKV